MPPASWGFLAWALETFLVGPGRKLRGVRMLWKDLLLKNSAPL